MEEETEQQQTKNYYRLVTLLIDVGGEALRDVLLNEFPQNQLGNAIQNNITLLSRLKSITKSQFDLLQETPPDPNKFDISLLVALLRNLCPHIKPDPDWKISVPGPGDDSMGAELLRIRNIRNEFMHISTTLVPKSTFQQLWLDLAATINRIALKVSPECGDKISTKVVLWKVADVNPAGEKERQLLSTLMDWKTQIIDKKVNSPQTSLERLHLKSVGSASEGTLSSGIEIAEAVDVDGKTPSRQNSDEAKTEFVSRYVTDFEHIETLGKGGFGIVFESKNKVDECHYAVKRIALPNSADAKEKVMREVKALAKLDHNGIVRYFNTWLESPPTGWQEERDKEIEDSECLSTPTPCNTVSQLGSMPYTPRTQHLSPGSANKYMFGSSPKPSHSPKQKSPMDFLQNPFGGNALDLSLSDEKKGGSEEFSVANSNWEEDDESGSFSCGMGTPNLSNFAMEDSLDIEFRFSESESTNNNCDNKSQYIPFCDNRNPKTGNQSVSMEDNSNSWKIVFEDSGCGDKSSKGSSCADVCIGIPGSQSGTCSQSHDTLHTNSSSYPKSHSRTHSRTNSHSFSKDLAKLFIEKEVKSDKSDKKESEKQIESKTGKRSDNLCQPKLYLFIQMQLCKRETLKDWLNANTLNRDRHMVLDMFDQIVCAVEYVHDCGLMHRDLKPSNIFFSLDGVIKMGDFGLATALPQEQNEAVYGPDNHPFKKHTAQVGTQLYMSPEQTAGKVYSQKVDIFSLGVILFELLYPIATQMERVNTLLGVKVQKFPERFNREMPKESDFVKSLLSPSPEARPTAKQLLECEFLKEFENRRMPRRFRTRTVSQNSS